MRRGSHVALRLAPGITALAALNAPKEAGGWHSSRAVCWHNH